MLMSEGLGKGIATVGIWIGAGIVSHADPDAFILTTLFALLATIAVWRSGNDPQEHMETDGTGSS
ncbi:MAG: hypothetical protein ACXQTS_05385 [Candidatus Methanospirareceae archaeon]